MKPNPAASVHAPIEFLFAIARHRTGAWLGSFGDDTMREYHDASGRLSIELGDDGPAFRLYASRLEETCKARRIQQLDGLDQRYWDYDVDGAMIVLHSDPGAGISLHIEDGVRDDLLRRVAAQITEPSASNGGPAMPSADSGVTGGPPSAS